MSASRARAGIVVALMVLAGCGGQDADVPRSDGPAPAAGPIGAGQATASGDDVPRDTVTLAFAGDMHFQLHLAGLLDRPRGALGPIARSLSDRT